MLPRKFLTLCRFIIDLMTDKIIIIGANGQIGTELVMTLRQIHGNDNVVASDIHNPGKTGEGPFEHVDVMDKANLTALFQKYQPTQVYLLAAILSATGEKNPKMAWDLNMTGL